VLRRDPLFTPAQPGHFAAPFELFDGGCQGCSPLGPRPSMRRSSGQSGGLAFVAPQQC
jgi:hypothetical protein